MPKRVIYFDPHAIDPGYPDGREITIDCPTQEDYGRTMATITNPERCITDIVVTDMPDLPPPPDPEAELAEIKELSLITMQAVAETYEMVLSLLGG